MSQLKCSIPLNYEALLLVDSNFGGTENWVAIKKGITNITQGNNETVDQKQYMDGLGFATSDITGEQIILSVSGDRIIGDAGQDFILSLQHELGCNRKSQAKFIDAEGNYKLGGVTIANIVPPGGDAASKGAISFEIHYNGKPGLIVATSAPELSAVVAAGSVSGSTSFTATPTADNTLGYVLTNTTPTSVKALSFVSVNAYTSGTDIAAVLDQVLCMVELDTNGRVVSFLSQTLASLDIMA